MHNILSEPSFFKCFLCVYQCCFSGNECVKARHHKRFRIILFLIYTQYIIPLSVILLKFCFLQWFPSTHLALIFHFSNPYHTSKLTVFLMTLNAILKVLNSWSFVFSCIPRVCTLSWTDQKFSKCLVNKSGVIVSSTVEYPLRPYSMLFTTTCPAYMGYYQQVTVNKPAK